MKTILLSLHRSARFYRALLMNPGRLSTEAGFVTGWGLRISRGCFLATGTRVSIGRECTVMAKVSLGDDVMISTRVAFVGRDHPLGDLGESLYDYEKLPPADIKVGSNVLIGFGAIIVGPCEIGDNAVVASGAVVTRDVSAASIVAGVPAVHVKGRWQ